jgi:hypothetical protein
MFIIIEIMKYDKEGKRYHLGKYDKEEDAAVQQNVCTSLNEI